MTGPADFSDAASRADATLAALERYDTTRDSEWLLAELERINGPIPTPAEYTADVEREQRLDHEWDMAEVRREIRGGW